MTQHNLIILDASNSMNDIYHEALHLVNQTLQSIIHSQIENPGINQTVSLALFSGPCQIRFIYYLESILKIQSITPREYILEGNSALYDAIGFVLSEGWNHVRYSDKVLVTIITDGKEDASERYTQAHVRSLIDRYKDRGWIFTYIGANPDALFEL